MLALRRTLYTNSFLRKSFGTKSKVSQTARTFSSKKTTMDMAYGPVNAFAMNMYAIACTNTKKAALIDCGASSLIELNGFLQWMKNKEYHLTAVFQTHAHLDHIAGLGLLNETDIPIHLHERERSLYEEFDEAKARWGFAVEGETPLPRADTLNYFDDSKTSLDLGDLTFEVVSTPGHSPGHVSFYEPVSKSFFGGDFIMRGSIGRTDFPTSSHADMTESLQRVSTTMDEDMTIYPGHGSPTSLKQEKESNPFLQSFR